MTANTIVHAHIGGHIKKAHAFELLVPNKKTIAAIKEARHGKLKSFNSIEELMASLNDEKD